MSDHLIALLLAVGTGVLFCTIGAVYGVLIRRHQPVIVRHILRAGLVVSVVALVLVHLIQQVLDTPIS